VVARDPAGREIGRTKTDADGKFTFTPRQRVDHNLTAETVDGHEGHYTVHAAELSAELPDSRQVDQPTAAGDSPIAPQAIPSNDSSVGAKVEELNQQIGELRRQIYESDERLRFRDICGGIGFILGLTGVAFYMKARQRRA
jgi:nickel transport protein